MARFNFVALAGVVLCVLSIPGWIVVFFSTFSFGSPEPQLYDDLRGLIKATCILYFLGVIVSLRTTLAGPLLVTTSAVVVTVEFWYLPDWVNEIPSLVEGFVVLGSIGSATVLAALFVQVTRTGSEMKGVWARFMTWTRWPGRLGSSEGPKLSFTFINLGRRGVAICLAAVLVIGIFSAAAFGANVSTLKVHLATDKSGQMNVALYIDGKLVKQETIVSGSLEWLAEHPISAGSHKFSLDLAYGTSIDLDGAMDYNRSFKVLPFATEYQFVGIGVGLV